MIGYTLLVLSSFLCYIYGENNMNLLLFTEVNETIWTQETTLIVYPIAQRAIGSEDQPEERGFCHRKCRQNLDNVNGGILLKTGFTCKCIFKAEIISRKKCLFYCLEDERLEGSERDICNYIDGKCFTYKFLKIEQNEK
jgi:hypothetical protein